MNLNSKIEIYIVTYTVIKREISIK